METVRCCAERETAAEREAAEREAADATVELDESALEIDESAHAPPQVRQMSQC